MNAHFRKKLTTRLLFTYVFILITLWAFDGMSQPKTCIKYPNKAYNAKVKDHLNIPTIFINGQAHSPIQYGLTDVPGGRWSWEELNTF